ncbi:hypothetical protein V1282_002907 [Nitrobacteraceae bacterium AZCC 2146]
MTDHIGLHEQYALVPPQTFVDRFTHQWTKEFDMPASEPLRKLWRIMASTYNQSSTQFKINQVAGVFSNHQPAQAKRWELWSTQVSKPNSMHL